MMVEPSEVTDMDLYLMQHGQARPKQRIASDPSRMPVERRCSVSLKEPGLLTVGISGCLHSG